MKRLLLILGAAALLAGCGTSPKNAGPTVFQGRFIGYNGEFVEFFLPTDDGDFQEIPVNVNPDGTFCDTIQFDKNLYDAALFADKFMFRICVEQGKTYNAEFDITEEGVETNFRFFGEGETENAFMAQYWALDMLEAIRNVTTFKECRTILADAYQPLREQLPSIPNKAFAQYHRAEIDQMENLYSYYFPFCAAVATGRCPDDPDFAAFVAGKGKKTDADFQSMMATIAPNVAYLMDGIDVTEALKAASSCTAKPAQKEKALMELLPAMVQAGNINGLEDGYDFFMENVTDDEALEQAEELCANALLLSPGTPAPDIEFEDLSGKVFHLADFAGKPLYIDLWASWCGPCCQEIPYLAKFAESLGKNPEIVCISISIDDERADWTAKLEEEKPSWPQYIATAQGQASISNRYFISAIPRFLLIDPEGKIASVNAPRPSSPDLLESLKSLL